jgi:mercuric reductase
LKPQGATLDYADLVREQKALITDLREANYEKVLPTLEDVNVVQGRGRLTGPHEITVGDERITADYILIATGSRNALPPIPGLAEAPVLTNENMFDLVAPPESLLVIGAGYIGLEAAQMFHRFDSKVTILQRSSHILSNQPEYVSEPLAEYLRAEGMQIETGVRFESVEHAEGTVTVHTDRGAMTGSHLLLAAGRHGITEDSGLEAQGVGLDANGFVEVNEQLQTKVPHIYAAGDVLGDRMFVYTASHEAELAVENMLTAAHRAPDYAALPWVVFTDPQVAGVGLDEFQAVEQGLVVETAELLVARWPRFRVAREDRGFLRLIRDPHTDLLVGARALAPEAGDLMTELGMVMKHRIKVKELAETLSPYLTLSEGIQRAAAKFYP